jgi:DNA-binding MarR family transcriptional regulator
MTETVTKRETPPLTVELVNELLYRRDLAVSRHVKAVARSLKLRDTEMSALRHLRYRGELTTSHVASLLGMSSAGTTSLAQKLTAAGLIRRRRDPQDGRCMLNRLTGEAARRLAFADAALDGALEDILAELTEEERTVVARFLDRLTALAERHGEARGDATDPPYQPVPSMWG